LEEKVSIWTKIEAISTLIVATAAFIAMGFAWYASAVANDINSRSLKITQESAALQNALYNSSSIKLDPYTASAILNYNTMHFVETQGFGIYTQVISIEGNFSVDVNVLSTFNGQVTMSLSLGSFYEYPQPQSSEFNASIVVDHPFETQLVQKDSVTTLHYNSPITVHFVSDYRPLAQKQSIANQSNSTFSDVLCSLVINTSLDELQSNITLQTQQSVIPLIVQYTPK
jgi:hypothetical protein